MRQALRLSLALAILVLAALPAAAQEVGLPNPASTFCVNTGGTLVITETGTGQSGTCVYESGLAVDEWALYRLFAGLPLSVLDW